MSTCTHKTLVFALAITACGSETPPIDDVARGDSSSAMPAMSAAEPDPLTLARTLTAKQRELFRMLGDPGSDPAALLQRPFRLVDRSDASSPQQGLNAAPGSYRDDYLRILSSRLPADEIISERFDLRRQQDGSVVILSHLPEGRVNLTVWELAAGSWKARAIILHPPTDELTWLDENTVPLLASTAG
jgi:hypothetical protein